MTTGSVLILSAARIESANVGGCAGGPSGGGAAGGGSDGGATAVAAATCWVGSNVGGADVAVAADEAAGAVGDPPVAGCVTAGVGDGFGVGFGVGLGVGFGVGLGVGFGVGEAGGTNADLTTK
jgi:hypothetical protein